MGGWIRVGLVGLLLQLPQLFAVAHAQPVASLDRERITLGESVVLRVEASRLVGAAPDLSVLADRVDVLQRAGRTEFHQGRSRSVWEFTLLPREQGVVGIPALDWAGGRTAPLSLTVLPARAGSAAAGDPIFIEVEIDDPEPYVQQALTYTLRLGYRVTLLEGRLDAPDVGDGGSLRQLGDDVSYQREAGGHRYRVVERRYVLVADRSGELRLGPPRFQGRVQPPGSPFGAFQSVVESGEAQVLQVRPRPRDAGDPWLAAREVRISLAPPPDTVRQGEPITLALRIRAEGVTRDQLSTISLPEGPGYQIYPEAPELDERVEDGRLVVEGVRRFVVVPLDEDRLVITPSALDWWNLANDQPAQAVIPGIDLAVEPDAGLADAAPGDVGVELGRGVFPGHVEPAATPWKWISFVLAAAWLLTLGLMLPGWLRSRRGRVAHPSATRDGPRPMRRSGAAMKLRRVLDEGDLSGIGHALVAAAPGPCAGLAQVAEMLEVQGQREAVELLAQARWGGGDPGVAREALRRAFRGGPQWRRTPPGEVRPRDPVPPLYPGGRS